MSSEPESAILSKETEPEWLGIVKAHIRDLRYGVVQLVIHDGRVTQIERTEKTRLPADGARVRV